MKQILQNLKTGKTILVDVPIPSGKSGHILIKSKASLISSGTERMLVEFGRANILEKERKQPERVREVLNKIQTDGLLPAIDAVRSKLDQPIQLGYSNVGSIVRNRDSEGGRGLDSERGSEVARERESGLKIGDRVVRNAQ